MKQPRILILHANGTNRDEEVAHAFQLAGALPEIVHIEALRNKQKNGSDYQILVIPGGFSYGDTLGAGRIFALDLQFYLIDLINEFIQSNKPILGICNGFQVLVKAGLLPYPQQKYATNGKEKNHVAQATLAANARGHFECRWVTLIPQSRKCLWTAELSEPIDCPVAHGEGQFVLRDATTIQQLRDQDQIALCYAYHDGTLAEQEYPYNPNGSIADVAGVCNAQGNILGLMPHPEDHVVDYQYPQWTRGIKGRLGLSLFKNGVHYVKSS